MPWTANPGKPRKTRSEEHTSELQSPCNLVCRLLLEKKKQALPRRGRGQRCVLSFFASRTQSPGQRSGCGPILRCRPDAEAGIVCRSFFFFFLLYGRPPSFPFFPSRPPSR